jgi:DNA integrity scanning protein DisA with diadenylate cyclase activity
VSDDTYPNAGRASGYTDGSGNDVGENIVNRVTELVLAQQTKLLALADRIDAVITKQDKRFDYMLRESDAYSKKEDARHDALERAENQALTALTSVAHRLDEITSYVQQSVTISREALAVAKAGEARLGKVEKAVATLETGQRASKKQADALLALFKESKADRADLRARIDALAVVMELHDALARDVAELKAWRETMEAHNG